MEWVQILNWILINSLLFIEIWKFELVKEPFVKKFFFVKDIVIMGSIFVN